LEEVIFINVDNETHEDDGFVSVVVGVMMLVGMGELSSRS